MPTTPPSPALRTGGASARPDRTQDSPADRDPGMLWLRLSGWLFLLLLLSTALALLLGSRLPAAQVLTVTTLLSAPPARIWRLLTDLPQQSSWRSDLDGLQPLRASASDPTSLPCWTELHGHLAVPLCVTASAPTARLDVAISDPSLPLQGSWSFNLQPIGTTSTRLTITETRQISTLLWRFAMHYRRGDRATLDLLAADLRSASGRP